MNNTSKSFDPSFILAFLFPFFDNTLDFKDAIDKCSVEVREATEEEPKIFADDILKLKEQGLKMTDDSQGTKLLNASSVFGFKAVSVRSLIFYPCQVSRADETKSTITSNLSIS